MRPSHPKVVPAPRAKTATLRPQVDRVLEALGFPGAFVTDYSAVGDFFVYFRYRMSQAQVDDERAAGILAGKFKMVAARLGVPVTATDRVWEVAERLLEKDRVRPPDVP